MGKHNLKIDPILFNGWLVSNLFASAVTPRSAGENVGGRPNGEDWLVIEPRAGLKFIDPENVTLPVDYVIMEANSSAWLYQLTQGTTTPPQILLSAAISDTYHKREAMDFLVIGQSKQNDIEALVSAKPSQFKILLERSLYKAMVVHAIGALMNKQYGHKLAEFQNAEDYHRALKNPASEIYLKLMKVMKQAGLGVKDVEELKQAALSEDKQCYEIMPLLDHYQRSELGEAATTSAFSNAQPRGVGGGVVSR